MPCLLAWGNNLTGTLDPISGEPVIPCPKHVLEDLSVDEIVWSGWANSIGRVEDEYYTWGSGMPGESGRTPTKLPLSGEPVKFLGADEATSYFDRVGHVRNLFGDGVISSAKWQDIVLTGLGAVYALSTEKIPSAGVYHFISIDAFMASTDPMPITHPLLKSASSLYATDSRVFTLTSGPLVHLLEIKSDGSVKLVEDLEGLGIESVIAGSANRLAVITEAGDAYLINNRSIEPELLELEDDSAVRFVGVGSKHEVVVTGENVWVRGENNFSQLGMDGEAQEEFVKLEYFDQEMVNRIKSVHCGRWSTIVVMHDS